MTKNIPKCGMSFGGVGLFLGDVWDFLGNVGLFLGIVRHGAEEKFEVRVGVYCGWKEMYYKSWILPFVLPAITRSYARIAKSFILFLSHLSRIYSKVVLFRVTRVFEIDFNKKTMGSHFFSVWPQTRSFFAIVSPPWGVDLGAVGQWCDKCDSKKTTILG